MLKKTISIIVPVYNEANDIVESLGRLAIYRDLACEIIVVDGGSSDNSTELAEPYADILLHSKKGRARQMNAGAAVAKGNVLLFLHADTQLPAFAGQTIERLRQEHLWGFFAIRLSGSNRAFRMVETFMNWRSKINAVATGDQTLFFRKTVFNQLGGFADIPLMEDVEICLRQRQNSRPYIVTEKVLTSSRRWQQNGIVRTVLLMWSLRFKYWLGISAYKLAQLY